MSEVILYHNPRCSKSRATLALLEERGIVPRIVEYLQTPLDLPELETVRRKLGRPAGEWVRTGESAYREAGLSATSDEREILAAMAARPILMERPIVVSGERAALGRPPERVLEIL